MIICGDLRLNVFSLVIKEHRRNGDVEKPSVIILFAADSVDALCTTKMITIILAEEDIPFSLLSLHSIDDLQRNNLLYYTNISFIFMVNCGGMIDVQSHLLSSFSTDLAVCIIDNHRPLHPRNIDDQSQIIVLLHESEEQDPPRSSKRRKVSSGGCYLSVASSLIMYEIACLFHKYSQSILWLSILGLTDQLIHQEIEESVYNKWVQSLDVPFHDEDDSPRERMFDSVFACEEFKLFTLRHWSLYYALYFSPYVAGVLGIWKEFGRKKLHALLLRMGISLQQSFTDWTFVHSDVKQSVKKLLKAAGKEFNLNNMTFPSFYKYIGNLQVSASDVVYALTACMNRSPSGFWAAYDLLTTKEPQLMEEAISIAMEVQERIIREGCSLIRNQVVMRLSSWRYVFLRHKEAYHFHNIHELKILQRFINDCLVDHGAQAKPFVVGALQSNKFLVTGFMGMIPSLHRRNYCEDHFVKAAELGKFALSWPSFDPCVVAIAEQDVDVFIEYLSSIFA